MITNGETKRQKKCQTFRCFLVEITWQATSEMGLSWMVNARPRAHPIKMEQKAR
jgi:hypothetical protein